MKTSILVPAAVVGGVAAALVLASPMNTGTEAEPAAAPDRAEVFAIADCGGMALTAVSEQTSWHDALGSKRVNDRALVLAKDGAAGSCKGPSQANRPLP
ncbi:MAG: hypothetical protein ACK4P8_00655 [Tabrizicola sp.]